MATSALRADSAPRALAVLGLALVGGGLLAMLVAVVASGGDLSAASAWWIAVAGGCACASGVVVGSTDHVVPAALFGVVAVVALGVAVSGRGEEAAVPARSEVAERVLPESAGRERDQSRARPGATSPGRVEAAPRVSSPGSAVGTDAAGRSPDRAAPAEPAGPATAATQLVRAYYAALHAGAFERAWARLTPAVQAAFGGFDAWRAGYATTVSHRVEEVHARTAATVTHVLVAVDRTPCGGTAERRFAVTWRLQNGRATELTAVKLAGTDPAAAC